VAVKTSRMLYEDVDRRHTVSETHHSGCPVQVDLGILGSFQLELRSRFAVFGYFAQLVTKILLGTKGYTLYKRRLYTISPSKHYHEHDLCSKAAEDCNGSAKHLALCLSPDWVWYRNFTDVHLNLPMI
jgi:hypothetical protein